MDILTNKTLLIVDDEPDLRSPLVMEFESLGCKVYEASNGREALEIIKQQHIDAVVSDIRMPGGDGIELLKNIKELNHAAPVVMLVTGYSDVPKQDVYDLGADAILSKPFDLDEIDAAVIRILTPKNELWSCEVSSEDISATFHQKHLSFAQAIASTQLRLGRGGAFIRTDKSFPARGVSVDFKVEFEQGEPQRLDAKGVVRWVRTEAAADLPSGIGVEFTCLESDARDVVVNYCESQKIKPFIPKK